MKEVISTKAAPAAIGPYSQGIVLDQLVFCSGQVAIIPETGKFAEPDIKVQTKQVLENIKGLLAAQNLDFSNVVKTTVFITNMNDFGTVNEIYAQYFVEPYPARSCVAVATLPKNALIEIEVIAAK